MICFNLSRLVFALRRDRARAQNSGPAVPRNIPGSTSIYRAPLFVTGPGPPSGALPQSLFFAAPCLGPRFRDRFRSRNEDFPHILSTKDTPDHEYAPSAAIRRTFSTEGMPEIHIPGAKLLRESGATSGAPQKPGTRNGE